MRVHVLVLAYVYVCVSTCVFTDMHVCMHVCIHIYVHRYTHTYPVHTHVCTQMSANSCGRLPIVVSDVGVPTWGHVLEAVGEANAAHKYR